MHKLKISAKKKITVLWLLVIVSALYLYFFKSMMILSWVASIKDLPLLLICTIYLFLGCIRGFTFIPVTYLIILGLIFLPPIPAYILTLAGVMVSSICIYYFSEYLSLADYFRKNHQKTINKLTSILQKNELPIVISWSFFPFAPTDVMCYVCGALEINIKKFIIGVMIGEGVACAIYIFLGKDILLVALPRVLGF
ncbi:MAG: VTT domain-containing protein [Nitrospira sp.]